MSDVGANTAVSNLTFTFDDAGALMNAIPLTSGTYRPSDIVVSTDLFGSPAPGAPYGTTLAGFIGTNPAGTWRLLIVDDEQGDTGAFSNGWSLIVSTGAAGDYGSTSGTLTIPAGTAAVNVNCTRQRRYVIRDSGNLQRPAFRRRRRHNRRRDCHRQDMERRLQESPLDGRAVRGCGSHQRTADHDQRRARPARSGTVSIRRNLDASGHGHPSGPHHRAAIGSARRVCAGVVHGCDARAGHHDQERAHRRNPDRGDGVSITSGRSAIEPWARSGASPRAAGSGHRLSDEPPR